MDIYNAIIDGPLFMAWFFSIQSFEFPANSNCPVYLVKEG